MVRLAVTVTVLFFLFSFSYARTPLDLPENDVTDQDLSSTSVESDAKAAILLPSEKPESEAANVVELEPENTESKPLGLETQPIESAEDLPGSDTNTVDPAHLTRPFTVVTFRPVNRHFQMKRPFSFRFFRRGCHHRFHPMNPRFHGREVSYGNDMIMAGENADRDPVMFNGGVRQIPARWVRFHHHHHDHEDGMPRFPFKHHHMYESEKENFKRPFHHEEEVEEREEKKGREEREEVGFMKRFRKFLNHF